MEEEVDGAKVTREFRTRMDEYWQSIGFMVNESALNALDEETRAGLLKAYGEAGDMSQKLMFDVADETIKNMEANGVTYTVLDTAPLVAKMKAYYADMDAKGELPAGFMDAIEASRTASQ